MKADGLVPLRVKGFYLCFGLVEFACAGLLGAVFLSYPSLAPHGPFWPYLIAGPLSILPASLLILWRPRWGAGWLIGSGLLAFALGLSYVFSSDLTDGLFALGVAPLPMLIGGVWLLLPQNTERWSRASVRRATAAADRWTVGTR